VIVPEARPASFGGGNARTSPALPESGFLARDLLKNHFINQAAA
jgi:hypothetical protein